MSFAPLTNVLPAGSTARLVHDLAWDGIAFGADRIAAPADSRWAAVSATGTRSWLDTGDLDEATALWNSSYSALTTNNTLLNKEVQKGAYDDLVTSAGKALAHLDTEERVIEIAFLLNARHALRLASRIGCRVSVELHTALAHDAERSLAYGLRFFALHGEHIIVKVPLTPAGLIAARALRAHGVPVNLTLGFSARQNLLATAFAAPTYVNVFLGRLNAYVADNKLGDGTNVGEKTTLASQRAVRQHSRGRLSPTWQIAASMRSGDQVLSLAGVDVHTMPTKVAQEARDLVDKVTDRTQDDPPVTLADTASPGDLEVLWAIPPDVEALVADLERDPPTTTEALTERIAAHDLSGIFPTFTDQEATALTTDGKIPKRDRWADRIQSGTASIDGLMTAAALASFTKDQQALDERIRRLMR